MADACSLEVQRIESGYLFRVIGRGTMRESTTVRELAAEALKTGAQVVLDLSGCEYLDSTFLGCLLILHDRGAKGQGSFAIRADDATRKRLISRSRLDQLLTVIERCPKCLSQPVKLRSPILEPSKLGAHLLETHRKLADFGGPGASAFRAIADQLESELDDVESDAPSGS
jgi:anti-anti-sigma factor